MNVRVLGNDAVLRQQSPVVRLTQGDENSVKGIVVNIELELRSAHAEIISIHWANRNPRVARLDRGRIRQFGEEIQGNFMVH